MSLDKHGTRRKGLNLPNFPNPFNSILAIAHLFINSTANIQYISETAKCFCMILGVIKFVRRATTTDTYDGLVNGFYAVYNAQQPSDGPGICNGIIFSYMIEQLGFQLIFKWNSPTSILYRIKNNTWSAWEQLDGSTTT